MLKEAVIYARFSSDKQDEASIDAQARACDALAEALPVKFGKKQA